MTARSDNAGLRHTGVAVAVAFLAILTALSFMRNGLWYNEVRIWRDAAHKSPNKARPNYYLGIAYDVHHETEKAFRYFAKAQEIDPDIVTDWLASSPSSSRRGVRSGPSPAAGSLLDAEHRLMLASAAINEGSYEQARVLLENILMADPAFTEAYLLLARVFNLRGQTDREYQTYKQAIAKGTAIPPMDIIYVNQGLILGSRGRHDEAARLFRESLRIADSYDAHYNLGVSLSNIGLSDEAAEEFRKAQQLRR